ncbi:MAG: hypothetical protein AB1778_06270 [Candidatus Bipolaricaulota bacterium]
MCLRPAVMSDRRPIYEALACSELTEVLLGRPGSLEAPAMTWEDFCSDPIDKTFEDSDVEGLVAPS